MPKRGIIGITSVSRIAGTPGPVAHSVRDLQLFFETLYSGRPWLNDISLVNLPWRQVDDEGKGLGYDRWQGTNGRLRIGIVREDGVVRPVRPIHRAMDLMVKALTSHGKAEVVEYDCKGWDAAWDITVTICPRARLIVQAALYYTDGGAKLRVALGNEPMLPLTQHIVAGCRALSLEEIETVRARTTRLKSH